MPYKDPEVKKACHKESSRKYYEKNKEKVKASSIASRARGKEKWDLYKGSLHCARCPENHIACMDFHHIDPNEKEYEVSNLVSNGFYAGVPGWILPFVDDAWQGSGVGMLLTLRLVDVARRMGFTELIAYVLADNRAMRGLLAATGLTWVPSAAHDLGSSVVSLSAQI